MDVVNEQGVERDPGEALAELMEGISAEQVDALFDLCGSMARKVAALGFRAERLRTHSARWCDNEAVRMTDDAGDLYETIIALECAVHDKGTEA